MLRIYSVVLDLVRNLRPLLKELERADADLARQCRRALTSVPLKIAEGSYSRGKNRRARYHNALGSMREVLACFEVAAALGYVDELDTHRVAAINRVLGTLVKLVGDAEPEPAQRRLELTVTLVPNVVPATSLPLHPEPEAPAGGARRPSPTRLRGRRAQRRGGV